MLLNHLSKNTWHIIYFKLYFIKILNFLNFLNCFCFFTYHNHSLLSSSKNIWKFFLKEKKFEMYNNYARVYLHNMLFMRMYILGLTFFFNWPMLEQKLTQFFMWQVMSDRKNMVSSCGSRILLHSYCHTGIKIM